MKHFPSHEEARRTFQEILSRKEFQPPSDWSGAILERIFEWLGRFAEHVPAEFGWLLAGLAALLAVWLLLRLLRLQSRGRALADAAPGVSFRTVFEDQAQTPQQALRAARRFFEQDQLREVLWICHRLLLVWLDRRQAIRFRAGKTNRDYLRECARDNPQFGLLEELSRAYEELIYAHRAGDRERVAGLLARVEALP